MKIAIRHDRAKIRKRKLATVSVPRENEVAPIVDKLVKHTLIGRMGDANLDGRASAPGSTRRIDRGKLVVLKVRVIDPDNLHVAARKLDEGSSVRNIRPSASGQFRHEPFDLEGLILNAITEVLWPGIAKEVAENVSLPRCVFVVGAEGQKPRAFEERRDIACDGIDSIFAGHVVAGIDDEVGLKRSEASQKFTLLRLFWK